MNRNTVDNAVPLTGLILGVTAV